MLQHQRKLHLGMYLRVPLNTAGCETQFYCCQTYDRENIADALVGKSFSAGEPVVRQGDDADGMYFVEVSLVGFHIFCILYFQ